MTDPEGQFDEGMRLLAVPNQGQRGVELIEAAADAGHAQAMERCAVFECMGVLRAIDWHKCFSRLRDAANAGSIDARRQLILFAEDRSDEVADAAPKDAIDPQRLFRPATPTRLRERPMMLSVDRIASSAECAWLIEVARRRLEVAFVNDPATGRRVADPARTNRGAAFPVDQTDCVIELIRQRLSLVIGIPVQCFEVSQVLHYDPGQEFKPHHDYLEPNAEGYREELNRNGQRIATALVYLNQDYEGGGTQFPKLGVTHRGKTGDALIFANVDPAGRGDPQTLHAGLPPTRGEKWIFSQWIREHPPGMGNP